MPDKETKNQLHQLLAVEPVLKANAKNIFFDETKTTLEKKQEHFDGVIKVYQPIEDGGDQIPDEVKEIVTIVSDKLNFAKDSMIKAIDAEISKEETNGSGKANAVLDINGKKFTLTATSLLVVEKYLEGIRSVYKSIPTLDPTKVWYPDDKAGDKVFTTEKDTKFRVVKRMVPLVLSPATDKHAAQVQVVARDDQVGKYLTTYKSGKITPLQKSILLSRIDDMIVSVKQARSKANQADVINANIGKEIFDSINNGII